MPDPDFKAAILSKKSDPLAGDGSSVALWRSKCAGQVIVRDDKINGNRPGRLVRSGQ